MHIGRNIKKLRSYLGIKQQAIAKQLNMSQQNYSLIENSEKVDDEILEKISEILEIPIDVIKYLDHNNQNVFFNFGNLKESVFYQNNPVEKIIELHERMLEEKEELNNLSNTI